MRNIANSRAQTVVGQWNEPTALSADTAGPPEAGVLFIVGNGNRAQDRSNAFEVHYSGLTTMKDALIENDATFEGDVTLSKAQGDISMGIYGND